MSLGAMLEQCIVGLRGVYGPQNVQRVRSDSLALFNECPSLQPYRALYTHIDGVQSTLLVCRGTVPIFYQRAKYNIPVDIWLPATYPHVAPLVFVTPTKNMVVAPNHRHVDTEGRVYLPYLHEWKAHESDLKTLVQFMVYVFGQATPLHSRPSGSTAASTSRSHNPPPSYSRIGGNNNNNNNNNNNGGGNISRSTSGGSGGSSRGRNDRPAPPYSAQPRSDVVAAAAAASASRKERSNSCDKKQRLEEDLTRALQKEIQSFLHESRDEMDGLLRTQQHLNEGQDKLETGLVGLRRQKKAIDDEIASLQERDEALQRWLCEHEEENEEDVDIDTLVVGGDGASRQLLAVVAEFNSIEDTIYNLDKALANDVISLSEHLKAVRRLASQQFDSRALSFKIAGQLEEKSQNRGGGKGGGAAYNSRPPPSYGSVWD